VSFAALYVLEWGNTDLYQIRAMFYRSAFGDRRYASGRAKAFANLYPMSGEDMVIADTSFPLDEFESSHLKLPRKPKRAHKPAALLDYSFTNEQLSALDRIEVKRKPRRLMWKK
jgi:hypothetical protein